MLIASASQAAEIQTFSVIGSSSSSAPLAAPMRDIAVPMLPTSPGAPGRPNEAYARLVNLIPPTGPLLKWPDKKIGLDVKNASIRRVAEILSEQTGIKFAVKEAVPSSLKITIQVGGMGVKQFLDTLCAATNLTYMADSRVDSKAPKVEEKSKAEITAPDIKFNATGNGYEMVAPIGSQLYVLNAGAGKPVTDVTISSLAAEGVVVNLGMVSLSVKDADPVEVATKLIKQINGASYIVMDLKNYLALQDPDRAAEIAKALESAPSKKITMTLRNRPITIALMELAQKGNFYISMPAGANNYLIIPDVHVVNAAILPPLSGPFAPF